MSFAPTTRQGGLQSPSQISNRNVSQPGGRRQQLNYDSPHLNTSNRTDRIVQTSSLNLQSVIQRLDMMESNLSRVCNQHDALMPLLTLLEYMPQLNKNESSLKQISRKQQDIEGKLQKLEQNVLQSNNQHVFGSIERNFKSTNQTIGKINGDFKDLKDNLNQVQKGSEQKLREEASHIYKNVDFKLEKNKKDIQNLLAEFKNTIAITMKKQEESQQFNQQNSNQSMTEGSVIQEEDEFEKSRTGGHGQKGGSFRDKDIQNLYRELGMLRCEIEVIYDRERRKTILQNYQRLDKKMDESQKQNFILKLNQAVLLEELEKFDQDNQERLAYELTQLDEKLETIREEKNFDVIKSELNYVEDKYFNLQQQIHGTKKKYLLDARRIEEKMDSLKSVLQDRNEIQEFQDRIDQINASIVQNVEDLKARQTKLDSRIQSFKLLYK